MMSVTCQKSSQGGSGNIATYLHWSSFKHTALEEWLREMALKVEVKVLKQFV